MPEPLLLQELQAAIKDEPAHAEYTVWIDDRDDEWVAIEVEWDHANQRLIIKA